MIFKKCFLLTILITLVACSEVQNSASRALDNANSAIKHSSRNAWKKTDSSQPRKKIEETSEEGVY